MLLLPYRRLSSTSFQILVIGIQSSIWNEPTVTDAIQGALEPNGIFLSGPIEYISVGSERLCLAPIDPIKTQVEDYYLWEEVIDEDTFCLRTLHILDAIPPPVDAVLSPIPLSTVLQALKST